MVPGDLIEIQANDQIPADILILQGDLTMDESMLTGEVKNLFSLCPLTNLQFSKRTISFLLKIARDIFFSKEQKF